MPGKAADEVAATTPTSYQSLVTTTYPPREESPDPSLSLTPGIATEPEFTSTDIAYDVAVIGQMNAPDGAPCPTIILEDEEFVLYPHESARLNLAAWDDQLVVIMGGPPEDPSELTLDCGEPVWVATRISSLDDVDMERPRLHPEPQWDPYYTPLAMQHETTVITFDRWFWAILDDVGFITVEVDGEVVLHGPSEWIVAHDSSIGLFRFHDPWKGRFVAALPAEIFDAAYTEAAISSGAWPDPADG